MSERSGQIVNVMKEERLFPPSPEFSAKARIKSVEEYERMRREAADDIPGFWAKFAPELHWFVPYEKVLEWEEPVAKWFVGGKTNVSYNCLDAHLSTHRRNKAALIWEGEPGDTRVYTYQMLHDEVSRFANVLRRLGIGKGNVVSMYMPMVPELVVAMLGCADWGGSLRYLRRILIRSDRGSKQGLLGQVDGYRRLWLAAWGKVAVEDQRRCGIGEIAGRPPLDCRQASRR